MVTVLGVAPWRSGGSRGCMAEPKLRRRHGFRVSGWCTLPFAPSGQRLRAPSCSGGSLANGLVASGAMPPFPGQHRGQASTATYNMSIDTDPQQQEAASPRVLVVRSFLRYLATWSMKEISTGPVIAGAAAGLGDRSSSLFRGAVVPLARPELEKGVKQTVMASSVRRGTSVPLVRVGAQLRLAGAGIAPRPGRTRPPHYCLSLQLCSAMLASRVLATCSPGNKSANTEPQLQEAASPQGLWSGCLQRYAA
jgi:hypothetical protein